MCIYFSEILDIHPKNIELSFNDDGTINYEITDEDFTTIDNVKTKMNTSDFVDDLKTKLDQSNQIIVDDVKPNVGF